MEPKYLYKDVKYYLSALPKLSRMTPLPLLIRKWPADSYSSTHIKDDGCSIRSLSLTMYRLMTKPIGQKPRGPTSGFSAALSIIFSGFCSRIDLYGFSSDGGPEYFKASGNTEMKIHHSVELESWIFHYLMKHYGQLNMCVYL